MAKLKLSAIQDDRPVKITIEIAASIYKNLTAYAGALGQQNGRTISEPTKLIAPMLAQFMRTDRAFRRAFKAASAPDEKL